MSKHTFHLNSQDILEAYVILGEDNGKKWFTCHVVLEGFSTGESKFVKNYKKNGYVNCGILDSVQYIKINDLFEISSRKKFYKKYKDMDALLDEFSLNVGDPISQINTIDLGARQVTSDFELFQFIKITLKDFVSKLTYIDDSPIIRNKERPVYFKIKDCKKKGKFINKCLPISWFISRLESHFYGQRLIEEKPTYQSIDMWSCRILTDFFNFQDYTPKSNNIPEVCEYFLEKAKKLHAEKVLLDKYNDFKKGKIHIRNKDKYICDGMTVGSIISNLEMRFCNKYSRCIDDKNYVKPSDEEVMQWCINNQKNYPHHIPEVYEYFLAKAEYLRCEVFVSKNWGVSKNG